VIILKSASYIVLAAALVLTGCGKQEKAEAARLAQVLASKQGDFENAGRTEQDFVGNARAWCAAIVANGAGHGAELDQNAAVAAQLSKMLVAASTELSQVRQPISELSFSKEYPQSVRGTLITQMTKRQRQLQEMRALLDQAAAQFLEYKNSRAYSGDSYPDGIAQMDARLKAYKEPEDVVGTALAELKSKYHLAGTDL
jgi:hypothetical protein